MGCKGKCACTSNSGADDESAQGTSAAEETHQLLLILLLGLRPVVGPVRLGGWCQPVRLVLPAVMIGTPHKLLPVFLPALLLAFGSVK